MKKLLGMLTGAAAMLLVSYGTGQAAPLPLTLTGPAVANIYGPQSTANPCIIAATNCQGSPLGYNLFSPNSGASFDRYSNAGSATNIPDGIQGTPYNALALAISAGGVTFDVAIDVNTTGNPTERLDLFQVIDTTQNRVLYQYTGPTSLVPINNNGNGFGDWLLSSISLTGIGVLATDGILFRAVWANAVDGGESFFIVNGRGGTGPELFDVPGETPIPGAVWLFASGLGIGGAFLRRRRRKEV